MYAFGGTYFFFFLQKLLMNHDLFTQEFVQRHSKGIRCGYGVLQ